MSSAIRRTTMFSRQCRLVVTAAFWLASSTNAFCSHQTNVARHWQAQQRATALYHHSRPNQRGNACDQKVKEKGRRKFLKQLLSFPPLLLPPLAFAEEDDGKTTIDKVETLLKDENELDADVVREESDEQKTIEDEKQLINELEKEITLVDGMEEDDESGVAEEVEKEADKLKGETEALIKEEEQLKIETEDMITKIEAIESEVQSLDEEDKTKTGDDDDTTAEKTSDAFVDKLKERVEQKEDLIARLKRQSEKDIDPKTGKSKAMTKKEYKERVKSTDTDFIKFLKETVANEQEWERDLEAFEGFLKREILPTVNEISKDLKPLVGEIERDLKPLVGEVEKEFRKDVVPAVGEVMQQLKEKAGSAADGELEDLKQRAEGLIGKLRSIF